MILCLSKQSQGRLLDIKMARCLKAGYGGYLVFMYIQKQESFSLLMTAVRTGSVFTAYLIKSLIYRDCLKFNKQMI